MSPQSEKKNISTRITKEDWNLLWDVAYKERTRPTTLMRNAMLKEIKKLAKKHGITYR